MVVGRYVVERELGAGGMGEVYLAHSPAGDPVAVKVIRPDRLDPTTRARFEREARIARTVIGTNRVARFLDADPFADRPWMAMEYVPGPTLFDHVIDHEPLPTPLVASLGALLAEGLHVVHEVGLLHRDLKPQNVIMGTHGPMLIDFGLGAFVDSAPDHLSRIGMIIGTVRCMAPEQARGRTDVTTAADVYGLGSVLLFAATGHYPFDGPSWEVVADQVAHPDQPPNLDDLPEELRPLVSAMLAHAATDRPGLDEVTRLCAGLITNDFRTPAEARRALIERTVTEPPRPPAPPRWVPERTPAIMDDAPALDESISDEESPEPVSEPVTTQRPPAARRIAGELRERYAAAATL